MTMYAQYTYSGPSSVLFASFKFQTMVYEYLSWELKTVYSLKSQCPSYTNIHK